MKKQELPVLKALHYGGRSYVRGDVVSVTPVDALALARRGYVSLTKGVSVKREAPPEPPAVAPTVAHTSALVPEPRTPAPVEAAPVEEAATPRRRYYRRRDLTAEPPNS